MPADEVLGGETPSRLKNWAQPDEIIEQVEVVVAVEQQERKSGIVDEELLRTGVKARSDQILCDDCTGFGCRIDVPARARASSKGGGHHRSGQGG